MNECIFSADRKYRYVLEHIVSPYVSRNLLFILLNPSTANEQKLDPTLTRCREFAKSFGYGKMTIVNLFSFRATDPKIMKKEIDPIGPENDKHILLEAEKTDLIVLGWGNGGQYQNRSKNLLDKLDSFMLYSLGKTTKSGEPRHPLYLRKDEKLEKYAPRRN